MRYRVQLRIREDTGEVEFFQVDTVDADPRAAGHNTAHDRVAAEVAGVLETDAEIDELHPAAAQRQPARPRARRQTIEEKRPRPTETRGA
jgi:hypothetical protein